jgi:transposase
MPSDYSTGQSRSTRRSLARTSMRPTSLESQGAGSNYKNPLIEPPDHALGRSRGGLSTKIHQLVDGCGFPLVVAVTPGQSGDSPMFLPLMRELRVARAIGRPRTTRDSVRADKAYSSRAIREHLRGRGIKAVIPEPADQAGHRKRRGSRGGRPRSFDTDDYRGRNVIERRCCHLKQWRGLATRYDKLAVVYRAAAVLHAVIAWAHRLACP